MTCNKAENELVTIWHVLQTTGYRDAPNCTCDVSVSLGELTEILFIVCLQSNFQKMSSVCVLCVALLMRE